MVFIMTWLLNKRFGPFIDGSWEDYTHKATAGLFEVHNPLTGEVLAAVATLKPDDISLVLESAEAAHSLWKKLPGHERAKHLYSIARHLQKNVSLLLQMEALTRGVQSKDPRDFDVPAMVRHFYYYAGWAQLNGGFTARLDSSGMVLGITSASSPLMTLAWIIAPALAAGCTVILKPPERAPLTALLLAQLCHDAGLPRGVLNVAPGSEEIGKLLAQKVRYITFCGSTAKGREIRWNTSGLCKSLTTLLSGKTPMLVFESADLDAAVEGVLDNAWFNQGQVPWTIRTLLVQESVFEAFVKKLKTRTIHIGNAFDKNADIGQPIDKKIINNVSEIISAARQNGTEVFQQYVSRDLPEGSFFPPTFLIGSQAESNRVISEDNICPVVSVIPFRTAKEAIALANNTRYGVAASVWTESLGLALEVTNQLQVGTVWINCHGVMDASIPFGGWKQSGLGSFGGREGLLEYILPKNTSGIVDSHEMDYKAFETQVDSESVSPADIKINDNSLVKVDHTYKLYYGGGHKRPDSNSSRTIPNLKGKKAFIVSEGNKKDIRNAVEVAVIAQQGWWKVGSFLRSQIIFNIAEKLQGCTENFSRLLKSVDPEFSKEVIPSLDLLFHWAASCDKKSISTENSTPIPNMTVQITQEPIGVIGIIIDDNSCLNSFIEHVAAAISFGNAVVVIPNMKYPTPAMELCQVFDTSDVPKGVINVITGDKQVLLSGLAQHQDVRAIWYSGSDGKMIKFLEWASGYNMKRTWVHCNWERNAIPREVFELNATQRKAVWMPAGEIFAN
ncbi:aldehyde dehydrogenase family 16 member A1 isoform X2 [Anabrus simplex]|uniref:aldehyde dehydrogenase family 16 member A1 isoform X2 n=1 Tax=Anabrus simplex TaxID=316456 RepID=UPI0035A37EDE